MVVDCVTSRLKETAKISFSEDFDAPPPPEGLGNLMSEASDDRWHAAKERSHDRDSMSEFEFAMSVLPESENAHGELMLSADELFFKGKLLPLYTPDYIDGSEQITSKCDKNHDQNDQFPARKRCSLSKKPTPTWALCGMHAENSAVKSMDLIVPTSPKAPKCSIKLRELFGFKRMAKSHCSCAASGEVDTASSSPCKPSKSSSRKQRAERNRQKTSLIVQTNAPLAPCKARHHLSLESDGSNKMASRRNSASEPLLTCGVSGNSRSGEMQLQYSVDAFKDHHQAHHQQYENLEKNAVNPPLCCNACDIACIQRSDRVQDDHANSLCIQTLSQELRELGTSCSEHVIRSGSSRRQSCEEKNRGMRGPSMRMGSGSETSPEKSICSASNATGAAGRQAAASASGFKSVGMSRAKSLERSNSSSSYSPKSLQRKYEQLKAIRQREGWRVLERSSSYNSSMHSMRVAPVLNVPSIVCISRSKSSNYAGIDSGLGHNLFPSKNTNMDMTKLNSSAGSAPSSKVQQLRLLQARRHSPNSFV